MKTNLLDFTLPQLTDHFAEMGEKPFRAKQVMRWMHQMGSADFAAMTDLAKTLRAKLETCAEVRVPQLMTEQASTDGTRKWLLDVGTGNGVETVFIPEDDRGTLCVSSQVGCALECTFCSTGRQGFNRNLSTAEIIGQLWWANKSMGITPKNERVVSNVVMMGMGEPLANYDSVVAAMQTVGAFPNAINIPVDELRARMAELPKDKEILETCQVGLRGHVACRMLSNCGFRVRNLSGGFKTYQMATAHY